MTCLTGKVTERRTTVPRCDSVWIVIREIAYEGDEFIGVFSSKAKAEEFVNTDGDIKRGGLHNIFIVEQEVDPDAAL